MPILKELRRATASSPATVLGTVTDRGSGTGWWRVAIADRTVSAYSEKVLAIGQDVVLNQGPAGYTVLVGGRQRRALFRKIEIEG